MKRTKHIYKRFVSLFVGQSFYITRKKLAVKTGFFSCREITAKPTEHRIAPWRRVRTLIPVTTRQNVQSPCDVIPDGAYFEVPQPSSAYFEVPQKTATTGCVGPELEGVPYVKDPYYAPAQIHVDLASRQVGKSASRQVGEPGHPDNPVFCSPQPLRDPMDQDHSPQPQPTNERTLDFIP